MSNSLLLDSEPIAAVDVAPSIDQWRALYKAAQAFRAISPWSFMSEKEFFGVVDPATGKTWYLSVRGEEQEPFGLIAFNGPAALAIVEKLNAGLADESVETLLAYADTIPEHDYLIAAFGARTELRDKDLDIVQTLKMKFHGARDWPVFRSVQRNSVDWFIDADEAHVLTLALVQALDVSRRRRSQPALVAAEGDTLLVRATVNGAWADERRAREAVPASQPLKPGTLDVAMLAHIKALPESDVTAEMSYHWGEQFEGADNSRQYFVRSAMMVNAQTGDLLSLTPLPRFDFENELVNAIAVACLGLDKRPAKVVVAQSDLAAAIAPVAAELGIAVEEAQKVEKVNELRKQGGLHAINALTRQ
ncbi:MAG TPA: hypothetical protein VGK19_13385 [Capsulimonadaceae bacterium]